jgi:hypothetical protein
VSEISFDDGTEVNTSLMGASTGFLESAAFLVGQ